VKTATFSVRSQNATIADLKTALKFGVVQETAQFSFVTQELMENLRG
jgi:hypothetical protein